MGLTREQFIERLVGCSLMASDDVRTMLDDMPDGRRPRDGEALAHELIRSERLTAFQAAALFEGRGHELVLGNYVLLDKLGEGGMGMVFKAEHRRMKRLVALKVLSPSYTKSPAAVQRFQREVEAVAKLEHTNIVTAYDADQAGDTHFLVMHFVSGDNLASIVRRHGPLTVADAVNCIVQAARGLEYAHSRGVIHRDIKPQNLLLDESGTVKILDLGLARLEPTGFETGQTSLTQSGTFMGTVDFVSPEQALGSKHADRRSDVYSLGCTLFYLLTATPMYAGDTLMSKVQAHREGTIPSLLALRREVPPALDAIFRRMVAKRADERYQTMIGLLHDLESLPDQMGKPNRRVSSAALKSVAASRSNTRVCGRTDVSDLSSVDQDTAADGADGHRAGTEIRSTIAQLPVESPIRRRGRASSGLVTAIISSIVSSRHSRAFWVGGSVVALSLGFVLAIMFGGRDTSTTAASQKPNGDGASKKTDGEPSTPSERTAGPASETPLDQPPNDADRPPPPPRRPLRPPFGRPRPGAPLLGSPPRDDQPPRDGPLVQPNND